MAGLLGVAIALGLVGSSWTFSRSEDELCGAWARARPWPGA
jgi:hypothetical protein